MSNQSNFRATQSQPPHSSRRGTLYPHDTAAPRHVGPVNLPAQPTSQTETSRARQSTIVPPRPQSQPAQSRVQRVPLSHTRGNVASQQPIPRPERGKARGFGTPIIPLRYRKTPPNPVRSHNTSPVPLVPMRPLYSSPNLTPSYGRSSPLSIHEPMRLANNTSSSQPSAGHSLRPDQTSNPSSSLKRSHAFMTSNILPPKRVRGTWQELAARYSEPPEDHGTRRSQESTQAFLPGHQTQDGDSMSQKQYELENGRKELSEAPSDYNSTTDYIGSVWAKQTDLKSESSQSMFSSSQRELSNQPSKTTFVHGFTQTDNPTEMEMLTQTNVPSTTDKFTQTTHRTSIADSLDKHYLECKTCPHGSHNGLRDTERKSNSSPADEEASRSKLNVDVEFAKSADLDTLITTRLRTGDHNVLEALKAEIVLNFLYHESNDDIRDDVLKMFR
ncbi:hypothetical protein F5Y18DRAFT_432548 [Xylariaceae sp. FL1019]|nr:hypothetical protein F5Y18DRAFT_432548 [Xylariaceae sp. FL1019]